jgi:hypothetical protein
MFCVNSPYFLLNIWKLHYFAVSLHHRNSVTGNPSRETRDEKNERMMARKKTKKLENPFVYQG